MWVRQCDLDAEAEAPLPIPAADRLERGVHSAAAVARAEGVRGPRSATSATTPRSRQGLSRRDFLRTGSGMAAALLALNQVFGDCYDVERRRGRRPEGVRGEVAQGPVHLRRPDAPRRRQPQVVRRHAGGPGHAARSSSMLRPAAKRRGEPRAAQPRPLRQGNLRRQRHGDGDHQRRAEPRVGQEPAAARPDGRHAQVRQRPGRLAARAVARPAAAEPRREGTRRDGAAGQGAEDRRLEDVHRRRAGREGVVPGRREGRLPVLGADEEARRQEPAASTRGCRWASSTRRPARRSTWRRRRRTGPTSTSSSTTPASAAPACSAAGTGEKVVRPEDRRPAGDPLDQRHLPHPEEEPEDQEHLLRAGQHVRPALGGAARRRACTCSAR